MRDRERWRDFINAVMNLQVLTIREKFIDNVSDYQFLKNISAKTKTKNIIVIIN